MILGFIKLDSWSINFVIIEVSPTLRLWPGYSAFHMPGTGKSGVPRGVAWKAMGSRLKTALWAPRNGWSSCFISHRIHGAAIYGNMDPINVPPMVIYIPAPWILWVSG